MLRCSLMLAVLLLINSVLSAQPPEERLNQLPPLLPVPPPEPSAPMPTASGTPLVAYDPGYHYIPERDPTATRVAERRFFDRWWINPSLEFAWSSTSAAPQTLKLRPPDVFGRAARLNVPLNGELTDPFQFGFGLSVGRWLGDERFHAIDGTLFVSGNSRSVEGFAQSTVVLFAEGPGRSRPVIVRFPEPLDAFAMPFTATAETTFLNLDLNYRIGLLITPDWRIDALAGYRYAYLEDALYLGSTPEDGDAAYREHRLAVQNSFHGGQVGISGVYRGSSWYTEGTAKLAYGGITSRTSATGTMLYNHQRIWLGSTTQSAFIPSLNVRLGVHVTARSRVFAGYSFQYITDVKRFENAMGCGCENDFWIQSLGLGFEIGY